LIIKKSLNLVCTSYNILNFIQNLIDGPVMVKYSNAESSAFEGKKEEE